jgi:hypothetical protein
MTRPTASSSRPPNSTVTQQTSGAAQIQSSSQANAAVSTPTAPPVVTNTTSGAGPHATLHAGLASGSLSVVPLPNIPTVILDLPVLYDDLSRHFTSQNTVISSIEYIRNIVYCILSNTGRQHSGRAQA